MLGVISGFVNNGNNSNISGFYVERIIKEVMHMIQVKPTDIIVSIEGSEINSISDLYRILNSKKITIV